MFWRRCTCLLISVALGACASRSFEVRPDPADPAQFAGWTCEALFDEMDLVQQRAADVAYAVDARYGNNVVALSLGVMVFWPALFAMRPDGPDAAELAKLKGRHEALHKAAEARGCGAPPDVMDAKRAAALPLAVGERLVYEERVNPRRRADEWGLRLTALRRGQLDFAVDVGGEPVGGVWTQDQAGNLVSAPNMAGTPQAGGLLYWTRLLPRELELGEAFTGELRHSGGGIAKVRGQVIATGVQTTLGRPFDAAVIELFGDLEGTPSATRVDGVMVVDRKSGVLLRLELRSGDPDFALRRTLVRIEPAG